MKLPLKLSRLHSSSPHSSTPSSPVSTPSASSSPTKKKKAVLSLPTIGSTTKTSKQQGMSGAASPSPPHGKGKSGQRFECNIAAASTSGVARDTGRLEMQQLFAQFDANGDGRISQEELQAVLVSVGEKVTMEEVASMMREGDADGDGFIDLKEFIEMNERCVSASVEEEEMAAAFAIFDSEKTGRIEAEGLQQVLQRLGGSLALRSSLEDCRRMIGAVDRKGEGHVDFDDFKQLLRPFVI